MSFIDELFDDMRNAPMSGSRAGHTEEGVYKVQLKGMFVKKSQDPAKAGAKMFVCEYKIVESCNDKHKPGTTGSWASKFDAFGYTVSDIKKLLFAATSFDVDDPASHVLVELIAKAVCDPSSKAVEELKTHGVDDAQALVCDSVVGLEVKKTISSKTNKEFSRHYWTAVA